MDRRVAKTRKSIRSAFEELIIEKDFSNITVKEIAERADINRKTFYLHYNSVDDVLNELETDIVNKLLKMIQEQEERADGLDIFLLLEFLTIMISENYELHKRLMLSNSYHFLFNKVQTIVKKHYVNLLKKQTSLDDLKVDLCATYIAVGTIAMYQNFFFSDPPIPKSELVTVASQLISGGLEAVIKND